MDEDVLRRKFESIDQNGDGRAQEPCRLRHVLRHVFRHVCLDMCVWACVFGHVFGHLLRRFESIDQNDDGRVEHMWLRQALSRVFF